MVKIVGKMVKGMEKFESESIEYGKVCDLLERDEGVLIDRKRLYEMLKRKGWAGSYVWVEEREEGSVFVEKIVIGKFG